MRDEMDCWFDVTRCSGENPRALFDWSFAEPQLGCFWVAGRINGLCICGVGHEAAYTNYVWQWYTIIWFGSFVYDYGEDGADRIDRVLSCSWTTCAYQYRLSWINAFSCTAFFYQALKYRYPLQWCVCIYKYQTRNFISSHAKSQSVSSRPKQEIQSRKFPQRNKPLSSATLSHGFTALSQELSHKGNSGNAAKTAEGPIRRYRNIEAPSKQFRKAFHWLGYPSRHHQHSTCIHRQCTLCTREGPHLKILVMPDSLLTRRSLSAYRSGELPISSIFVFLSVSWVRVSNRQGCLEDKHFPLSVGLRRASVTRFVANANHTSIFLWGSCCFI